MKIGIILHPYGEQMPGGLPRVIFEWTKALLGRDQENEYIIYLKHQPKTMPSLPGKNWRVAVLGSGYLWLNRLRNGPKADAYVFNTPVLPLFFRPAKSVSIVYDFPYKHLPPRDLKDRLRRIVIGWYHGFSLRRAGAIVAISHSTKDEIIKFFNINPGKIKVIYHGFKSICVLPEQKLDLPDKFFFFAGTLKERKNVLNIVRAYNLFRKARPDIGMKLVLSGKSEGTYYEALKKYVAQEGLAEDVVFSGYLNDGQLSYVYKKASALVFPSIIEGSGNPILEAMDCGLPVITSNIFGPAELGSGGSALLVDPYSVEELASAMQKVAMDKKVREFLIEKGRRQIKKFSWDTAVRELLSVIKSL
ncbi:MAG: glycosyltransferase family 4 protein [Candidatus Harrisonbacteria bacterium]|nr:glycosyltransferase family 4 protein [Candidatus Harrisonbacteria bacterium]